MAKPILHVQDISEVLNSLAKQFSGQLPIVEEDLTNLVDYGKAYDDLTEGDKRALEGELVAVVTQQIFVKSKFIASGINLIKSFYTAGGNGSIIQKIRMRDFVAKSDPSFDPAPGSTNDPFVNNPIALESEYFLHKIAEMVEYSLPENWFTGMFLSVENLSSMTALIVDTANRSINIHIEQITRGLINATMAYDLVSGKAGKVINVLALYNETFAPDVPLTEATSRTAPEFLRFFAFVLDDNLARIKDYNGTSNDKNYPESHGDEDLILILNSSFLAGYNKYLLADTFNPEYLNLPNYHKVWKWQGIGVDGGTFEENTEINVTVDVDGDKIPVKQSGVIGILMAKDRAGIYDLKQLTTSMHDPIGLKTNMFHHISGSTMIDHYEDSFTMYVADPENDFVALANA